MANSKFVFMITSTLLALTIFSALARPIMQSDDNKKEIATLDENVALWRRHMIGSNNIGDQFGTNDFRPTDPGHSPGAGHAFPGFAAAAAGAPMP
ncbi:hypothetical protein HN51_042410 [Arachis hypogaea]